jgi:hypothetical protein
MLWLLCCGRRHDGEELLNLAMHSGCRGEADAGEADSIERRNGQPKRPQAAELIPRRRDSSVREYRGVVL